MRRISAELGSNVERRHQPNSFPSDAPSGFKDLPPAVRTSLAVTLICVVVGLIASGALCFVLSPIHAGELHPELSDRDSAYIEAYGFPLGYWVPHDPHARSAKQGALFLWSNFFANAGLLAIFTLLLLIPLWIFPARKPDNP